MDHVTSKQVSQYRSDPMAFFSGLRIQTAMGTHILSDVWADFQRDFFESISPSLLAVAEGRKGPRRGFWLERTKGASKDSDVGCCLLWLLLFSPRALRIEGGAEEQDQILETREAIVETAIRNPWMEPYLTFQTGRIISKRNRSQLIFKTTDRRSEASAKHGSRPDVTFCNELSHVTAKAFVQTMLDNADKVPTNLRIMATNAGSVRTWQHEWRERYRQDPLWFFQKVDHPAPWIDEDVLKDAKLRNTLSRYLRLWSGKWTTGESEALNEGDIQWAKERWRCPMDGDEPGYVFVSGLDLGVKHDHAAYVTLGCRLGSGCVRLANCLSWRPSALTGEVDLRAVRKAIRDEYRRFNPIWMGYDPSQAHLMIQDLKHSWTDEETGEKYAPIPFHILVEWNFSSRNVRDTMARDILSSFRQRKLELYPDQQLIDDLHRLQIAERAFGLFQLEAVSDDTGHADRAVALTIALPVALAVAQVDAPDPDEPADDFGNYAGCTT